MTLNAMPMTRAFSYNGRILPDIDPSQTPEQIKLFYSAMHPELTSAVVEGGECSGTTQTWSFKRAVGTKG